MINFNHKKLTVICIVLAVILCVSIIYNVVVHIENDKLKNEQVRQMSAEWYEISELSRIVDNYIKSNSTDGVKYQKLVNKLSYHFGLAVTVSELDWNMSSLLRLSYEPLFTNLVNENETVNKEKAIKLLKEMNSFLTEISKHIQKMSDRQKHRFTNQSSSEYKELDTKVKDFNNKYEKLVDNYFKGF